MKKSVYISLLLSLVILGGIYVKRKFYNTKRLIENTKTKERGNLKRNEIQNGDIIFQTSLSSQSKAIQLATNSKYSHCGLIFKEGNDYYVFEAIQPVKKTRLDKWIARGKDGHFVVKRLRNSEAILTESVLVKLKQAGEPFSGKDYDLTFEWSDDKIYCSELIWKIYKQATGIAIGKLERLDDFDLTSDIVKTKINERFGNNIPKEEIVISPKAIYDSELLETIIEN